jgi:metallophosphoesterase superfamily enzyme
MLELKPEGFHLAEAAREPVSVSGRQLIADNSGALWWPSQRTLLVADLQLESRPASRNGHATPLLPSPTRETLTRLAEVMDHYEPARVIALAERLPGSSASAGLTAEEAEILSILQEGREWIWVAGCGGNGAVPQPGGQVCGELQLSGMVLRYRPSPGWATNEIGASLRPVAHISLYGYSLRRACFVGNGRRLVMPAFGGPLRGCNVLDTAFRPMFGTSGMAVWLLGHGGLYPVATRFLAGD